MGNLCYHVGFFTSLFLVENTAADLPGRPPVHAPSSLRQGCGSAWRPAGPAPVTAGRGPPVPQPVSSFGGSGTWQGEADWF